MKIKITVIILAIALGVGFLAFSTTGEATHQHLKLTEFAQKTEKENMQFKGQYLTVYGKVKEGTVQKKGIQADFKIEESGKELAVFFNGKTLLPDTFKEGADAAVEGRYDAAKKVFVADKVMAKCASKYENPESGTTMRGYKQ